MNHISIYNITRMLKTVEYLRYESKAHSTEEIREKLNKMFIKMMVNGDRMVLSIGVNHRKRMDSPLMQECNGLILDTETFAPVLIPPKTLRTDFNKDEVNRNIILGNYKIYHAIDGTFFSLYFDKSAWIISTMNGINMNEVKWETIKDDNTKKTFKDIIIDCLYSNNSTDKNEIWDMFTSGLDINKTYSMVFRHPEIHKFREGKIDTETSLHFIQAFKLAEYLKYTDSLDNENTCNLADQTATSSFVITTIPAELNSYVSILTEVGNVKELKDLVNTCRYAKKNYMEIRPKNNLYKPCYGYILRGPTDIYMESTLMHIIKNIWYDRSFNQTCERNFWPKETSIVFKQFLRPGVEAEFLALFPQYKDKFVSYKEILCGMIECTVCKLSGTIDTKKNKKRYEKYIPVADIIINKFNTQSEKFPIAQSGDAEKTRIVVEFIYNINMFEILLGALHPYLG